MSEFTAKVAGVYAVEANVCFLNAQGDYYRLIVARNANKDGAFSKLNTINSGGKEDFINEFMNSGFHAIRGGAPNDAYTLSVSGFMLMAVGDTANIFMFGSGDPYRLTNEGGFSMALVHAM